MFGGLRQNSVFYVLEKAERPSLKVAQVVSVSNPTPRYNVPANGLYQQPEQVVDVSVKAGEETLEFKQLPTQQTIANSGNVVVSDSREAMLSEVEGMKRVSQSVLDSIDYHQGVIEACEDMLSTLNPHIAKEREQEQRINGIEERMGGIEGTLGKIYSMLSAERSQSKSNK